MMQVIRANQTRIKTNIKNRSEMGKKTDFVRIGREGMSVDGRPVSGQDLMDMADTYSQDLYAARIWLEHYRGLVPGGIFDALGDVFELKAERLAVDGMIYLFAKLDALPRLVEWNELGQKLFTSMEIFTDPNTNKAYLGGLAVTDSPASMGTEAIQLYSTMGRVNADHLYTIPMEFNMSDPANPENNNAPNTSTGEPESQSGFFSTISNMLTKKEKTDDQRFTDVEKSIVLIADELKKFTAKPADKNETPAKVDISENEEFTTLKKAHEDLLEEFSTLKKTLEETPDNNFNRKPADGGDGKIVSDF